MRSWFTKFTGAVFASALASAAALLAGILALRGLPADQAGRFTLITSAAGMLGVIALFGQSTLISRLYARHSTAYHWPRDLLNSLLVSAAITAAGVAVVALTFRFTAFELAFVGAFALLTALIQVAAAMLSSYRQYVLASVLVRLSNALLVVPLGIAALGLLALDGDRLLGFQLLIAVLCGVLAVIGVRALLPAPGGMPPIPIKQRGESIGFAILIFTHLLLDPGLIVLAGYYLSATDIAGFGAYFTLFGPFLLVWGILLQTVGVEFGRNPAFPKRNLLLVVWSALVPVVLTTWAVLPGLASLLYQSKYDAFSGVALPMGLMGGLLLTEAVPRGFISIMAPAAALRRYIAVQAAFAVAMAVLILLLVGRFGVHGAAWAGAIMLVGRNVIAYASFAGLQAAAPSPAEQQLL